MVGRTGFELVANGLKEASMISIGYTDLKELQ